MAHFAKVENGIVVDVIVVGDEFENTFAQDREAFGEQWVQTSYNTKSGEHRLGGTPLRANFAGIGYVYDEEYDIFYHPFQKSNMFPSWSWDNKKGCPVPPIPMPLDGGKYAWDEEEKNWVLMEIFFQKHNLK